MKGSGILAVDDTPANLQLLVGMLRNCGYKVRPVSNGAAALEAARANPPELILLDITMPGMDGYEVCQRLKADPLLCDIPVLFISALSDTLDKVRAFGVGGLDYITKPFQCEEVQARVKTHLELHRQKSELAASLRRQADLEKMRDSLTHMIVHDMKSPLTTLRMTLDLAHMSVSADDEDAQLIFSNAFASVTDLVEMADQMLEISRMEEGCMILRRSSQQLGALAAEVVAKMEAQQRGRVLRLEALPAREVSCDAGIIRRVIGNLVGNALKYSPPRGEVRVRVEEVEGGVRVSVADDGPGIAQEFHGRIFEKFAQIENPSLQPGTGLGLTFCRMAVEAHGGSIGLDSAPGKGSCFHFVLPLPGE